MGLLDGLLQQAGGLANVAARNPQAIAAIASLLSTHDGSVGGTGGLGGLVTQFQQKGLGSMIASWIGTGPNPPITAAQVTDVLGNQTVKEFATKAGVPLGEAGGLLASLLPAVVDRVTPKGAVPETASLDSTLGGLLSGLLK